MCDAAEVFPDENPGMREPFPRLVGERRLSDRKARAVTPVCCLKQRAKCWLEQKPRSMATLVIDISGYCKSSLARLILTCIRYWCGVVPSSRVNISVKWPTERRAIRAKSVRC